MPRTLIQPTRRLTYLASFVWAVADEIIADVANGNYVPNDGGTLIFFHNNHATVSQTMTIITPGTVAGQQIGDLPFPISALRRGMVGPFPRAIFGDQILIDSTTVDLSYIPFSVFPTLRE